MIATCSEAYRRAWGQVPQGLAVLRGVPRRPGNAAVAAAREPALERLRADRERILERIGSYEACFAELGYACPLRGQLERTLERGFPELNRFVDTLLVAEMSTGFLMGIQDAGATEGPLVYDALEAAERYEGMRAPVVCRPGEVVVRDGRGIIASLFQGADRRTSITRATTDAVVFALGVPGITADELRVGMDVALAILSPCAASTEVQILAPSPA
jgi:DNA/RNA-binding domain of Phe-tRNA-synthetase-like protein